VSITIEEHEKDGKTSAPPDFFIENAPLTIVKQ
jgi:hypothetical protein